MSSEDPHPSAPPASVPQLAEVFRVVGPLYRLAARRVAADEAIEGVSTGVRAVLEHLHHEGPSTMPAVAAALVVSRQYVQRMAQEGAAMGLVATVDNPSHRRSSLLETTPSGRGVIERILGREQAVLRAAGPMPEADVEACLRVLRHLQATLDGAERSGAGRASAP